MGWKDEFAVIKEEWKGIKTDIEKLVEVVRTSSGLPQEIVGIVGEIEKRVSPVATAIENFRKKI